MSIFHKCMIYLSLLRLMMNLTLEFVNPWSPLFLSSYCFFLWKKAKSAVNGVPSEDSQDPLIEVWIIWIINKNNSWKSTYQQIEFIKFSVGVANQFEKHTRELGKQMALWKNWFGQFFVTWKYFWISKYIRSGENKCADSIQKKMTKYSIFSIRDGTIIIARFDI